MMRRDLHAALTVEEAEVAPKVDLPGDATTFSLPNGWLQPGTIYVLDIKVIAENGNQTVTDLWFPPLTNRS